MEDKSIQFLHNLNDGGLLYLNQYLETKCECSVFHISPSNRLIYKGNDFETVQNLKKDIEKMSFDGEFLYIKELNCMAYDFRVNDYRNRFVFYPVKERDCSFIIKEINEILPPMSYFLKGLYYSFGRYKSLLQNDTSRIFSSDKEYWKNLIISKQLNPNEEIAVVIVQPLQRTDRLERIHRMVQNFSLRYGGSDIINYINNESIVQIIPSRYKPLKESGGSHEGKSRYPVYLLPELLHDEFGGKYRISIGSKVRYEDMFDSYIQALACIFYCDYFRKENEIIHYKSVGPATRLLQTDMDRTRSYLEEKYITLEKYESDRNGLLLSTLRELVRSRFNYQEAAQILHIHLNTLYYRQDKISGIIGAELSELETKIIVYEEMFAYDFIKQYHSENSDKK